MKNNYIKTVLLALIFFFAPSIVIGQSEQFLAKREMYNNSDVDTRAYPYLSVKVSFHDPANKIGSKEYRGLFNRIKYFMPYAELENSVTSSKVSIPLFIYKKNGKEMTVNQFGSRSLINTYYIDPDAPINNLNINVGQVTKKRNELISFLNELSSFSGTILSTINNPASIIQFNESNSLLKKLNEVNERLTSSNSSTHISEFMFEVSDWHQRDIRSKRVDIFFLKDKSSEITFREEDWVLKKQGNDFLLVSRSENSIKFEDAPFYLIEYGYSNYNKPIKDEDSIPSSVRVSPSGLEQIDIDILSDNIGKFSAYLSPEQYHLERFLLRFLHHAKSISRIVGSENDHEKIQVTYDYLESKEKLREYEDNELFLDHYINIVNEFDRYLANQPAVTTYRPYLERIVEFNTNFDRYRRGFLLLDKIDRSAVDSISEIAYSYQHLAAANPNILGHLYMIETKNKLGAIANDIYTRLNNKLAHINMRNITPEDLVVLEKMREIQWLNNECRTALTDFFDRYSRLQSQNQLLVLKQNKINSLLAIRLTLEENASLLRSNKTALESLIAFQGNSERRRAFIAQKLVLVEENLRRNSNLRDSINNFMKDVREANLSEIEEVLRIDQNNIFHSASARILSESRHLTEVNQTFAREVTTSRSPLRISYSPDSSVSVEYSSPRKNGRIIFGSLVPMNQLWRTGANEATVLKFHKRCTIGSFTFNPGETVSIFSIPGETSWKILFNSDSMLWGTFGYDRNKTIYELEITPTLVEGDLVEELTIDFQHLEAEPNNYSLRIVWDDTQNLIPIRVNPG